MAVTVPAADDDGWGVINWTAAIIATRRGHNAAGQPEQADRAEQSE